MTQRTHFKKHSMLFVLVLIVVITFGQTNYAFTDVMPDDQGAAFIEEFQNRGLTKGYPDGSYKPENSITRAEFVTLINRTFEFVDMVEIDFTDVKGNEWYAEDLKKAVAAGYIEGYPDKTFRAEKSISREEAAVVINRVLKYKPTDYIEIGDEIQVWATEAVQALVDHNIMALDAGQFAGSSMLNRRDMAVSLVTVLHQKEAVSDMPAEAVDKPSSGSTGGSGSGGGTRPIQDDEPTGEVIYSMKQTIKGLKEVQEQEDEYSKKLDNFQLELIVDTQKAMEAYLDDYDFDYEGAAEEVKAGYNTLPEDGQLDLENAINASVPYKYIDTLQEFFGE